MITKEELVRFVSSRSWYQTIQFEDDVRSKGCDWCGEPAWSNIIKFLPNSLEGKSVLDLGCNAGLFCIRAALKGAKEVIGIDYPGWRPNWDFGEQQVFLKDYFEQKSGKKLPIKFLSGRMEDFVKQFASENKKFNYVLGIASLYYTNDPDGTVEAISKITDKVIIRLRDGNRIARFTKLFKKFGFEEKEVLQEKWWEILNRPTDDFFMYLFEKQKVYEAGDDWEEMPY